MRESTRGCLLCSFKEDEYTKVHSEVMLACGQFYRMLTLPMYIKHLQEGCLKCANYTLSEICKKSLVELHKHHVDVTRFEVYNSQSTVISTEIHQHLMTMCVWLKLNRRQLVHLGRNRKEYFEENVFGEVLKVYDYPWLQEQESKNTHFVLCEAKNSLLTFGRVKSFNAKTVWCQGMTFNTPEFVHNRDNIQWRMQIRNHSLGYVTFECQKENGSNFTCTFNDTLFFNFYRCFLLLFERQLKLIIYHFFRFRFASVVTEIIDDFVILDALDHGIAFCTLICELD